MRNYVALPMPTAEEIERFNSYVERTDDCWIWRGSLRTGRGLFTFRGHSRSAPRIAYVIAHGSIADLDVCHSCDNPACVNPDHMWLGTHHDNMHDAAVKGRMKKPRKTHCVNGHEFTPENTYLRPDNGKQQCKTCRAIRCRRSRQGCNEYVLTAHGVVPLADGGSAVWL